VRVNFLNYLSRYATFCLAIALGIGLLFPTLAHWLRPSLPVVVLLLLAFTLLRINPKELLDQRKHTVIITLILTWLLIISPLLVVLLCKYLGLPFGIVAALVLMSAAPPISSAPAIMMLIGLDASLGVVIVLIATLLSPFTIPLVALQFLDLELGMDTVEFVTRLLLFVGAAVLIATVCQKSIGTVRLARHASQIDGLMTGLLVLFGIAIMDGMADKLIAQSAHILFVTTIAFVANVALQIVCAIIFIRAGKLTAITAGFTSGNRNMALLLAVLPTSVPQDTILFFVVGQLPVFILPMLMVPLYRIFLK